MNDNEKWFVVSVKRGNELKIKEWFDNLPRTGKNSGVITEICVPTQIVYKVKNSKNIRELQPKLPGYIFIKIKVDATQLEHPEEIESKVKNFFTESPFRLYFVTAEEHGGDKHIYPMTKKAVNMFINGENDTITPSTGAIDFGINEKVKIISGPFKDFFGTITSINKKNNSAKLKISFFSRDMEIDIPLSLISKNYK